MEITKLIARCLLPLELPGEELNYLAKTTIQAMEQRLGELSGSVESAKEQVDQFRDKYRMNYADFKQLYLENPAGKEEDFVNWGFWEKILLNRGALISRYEQLLTTRTN